MLCLCNLVILKRNEIGDHPERASKYKKYLDDPMFDGLEYPIPLNERIYKKFEEKSGLAINVYTLDNKNKCVNSAYVSDNTNAKDRVNLLLLKNKDCDCKKECNHINYRYHYCWIKN